MIDLITIAIPVYNVSAYIERCLLSALSQTYRPLEILIIDDCGSDDSMYKVRNLLLAEVNGGVECAVRIIEHEHNLGAGASRNSAIDHASGKYLFYLDGDDELEPECIELLHNEQIRSGVDVVCGSSAIISESSEYVANISACKVYTERDRKSLIQSYFNGRFPVETWNKLYELSYLRRSDIRCVASQTIEDNYFTFHLLLKIRSYSIIPSITYRHRLHCSSTTSGGLWPAPVYPQWTRIFADQLRLLEDIDCNDTLRLTIKKKLFWFRIAISEKALTSPLNTISYIKSYLSPEHLSDRDTLRSVFLLCAYIFCCMPLYIKCIFLHYHLNHK
jgi:glycosyltransferase involved in cell wall biosynthesis